MSGPLRFSPDFLKSWLLSESDAGALLEIRPGHLLLGYGAKQFPSAASESAADLANAGVDFFAPDFFLTDPSPWQRFSFSVEVTREELRSGLIAALELSSTLSPPGPRWSDRLSWDEPQKDGFKAQLEHLLELFARGEMSKAVPVVFAKTSGSPGPQDRARMILSLLERAEGSRIYGFWKADEGLLGATPEVLFQVDSQGDLETMALAGTVPRAEGSSALWNSEKDQREHRHVIEDIRERIGSLGRISFGETHVCELPALYHLRTRITLRSDQSVPFEEWVKRMHPTAALGGYPREASGEWLRQQDRGVARGRFGAPFGVRFGDGSGICVVAIRGIQWAQGVTRLGSGCGVVQGSDLEREWRELFYKRASVKKQLGLEE